MDINIIEEVEKIEISNESIEERIFELVNIINMKVDYIKQINLIERLINDIE